MNVEFTKTGYRWLLDDGKIISLTKKERNEIVEHILEQAEDESIDPESLRDDCND